MKIAVISPHPDDETLGAGGTLLRFRNEGHQIYWINVTDVAIEYGWDLAFIEKRKEQIHNICKFFQFDQMFNLKFQPAKLEMMESGKLIQAIAKCFETIKPDWIIIPNDKDAHSDHKIVYDACMACSKSFRYPYIKKITTMEILSETDFSKEGIMFSPNYFVDITGYMEDKIKALEFYDTEMGELPFPRCSEAVEALATVRGVCAGNRYAEAFHIIKWME